MNRRLVLIEWEDSATPHGWQQLDQPIEDRALTCRSVGWLFLDGMHVKVIAPHVNDVPNQASGVMTIPTRTIIRISDLAEPDALPDNTAPTLGPDTERDQPGPQVSPPKQGPVAERAVPPPSHEMVKELPRRSAAINLRDSLIHEEFIKSLSLM